MSTPQVRAGLLPAPARTAGDHRRYDERALDRLQFIRGGKRLGLRLDAIAELLQLRDAGECPCDSAVDMLRSRLAEIDAEMTRLAGLRGQIQAMLAAIPGPACPDPAPDTWRPGHHPRRRHGDLRAERLLPVRYQHRKEMTTDAMPMLR